MSYTLTDHVEWLPNQGWDSRVHVAANGDLVNVFLVVTERYVILVDTLLNERTAQQLVDRAELFLATRQLLVVNSHADWDHAWGNQLFAGTQPRRPAPVLAHANGAARFSQLESAAYLQKMQQERSDIFADVTLTAPTVTFSHDLWIDGGDLTLRLFPTPGHTPDHIAIFIPEISILLAGDAAEIPFPIIYRASDLPVMRASLRAMADLAPRHALYCHAPPMTGVQLLHDNITYYDALENACRAAQRSGLNTRGIGNAALPALLDCHYEDVVPLTGAWADVGQTSRTERHGQNLRMMLAWLANEEFTVTED